MTGTVDNLRGITPEQPLKRAALFDVIGFAEDPTQVIVDDGSAYLAIPCLDGYRRRAPGDRVLAVQLRGNDWVILGKISEDESPILDVQQGTGAPSGGTWRPAAEVWVTDHLDGTRSLHFDMTGADAPPVIVEATDAITWNGADPTRDLLDVDGTRLAAWYYDGNIAAACVGETPTAMFLRITRSEEGGADQPLPLRLGMHGGLIAAPLATNFWDPGIALVRGQTALVPIPSIYLSVIADGTVGGFVAHAEEDAHAMRFEPTADLQIHFG